MSTSILATEEATKRATRRWMMAPEIWNLVAENLPTLSLTPAVEVFGKCGLTLSDAQEKHSRIWNMIFRDLEFASKAEAKGLHLALLGKDLEYLYKDSRIRSHKRKTKLMLLIEAKKPMGDYRQIEKDIFASLRPIRDPDHKHSLVITLKDSNITLDLRAAIGGERFVSITPTYYFSLYRNRVDSFYIYWEDSRHKLREISSRDFRVQNKDTGLWELDRKPQTTLRGKDEWAKLVLQAPDGINFRQLLRIFRG
jgi:hypothetical protein